MEDEELVFERIPVVSPEKEKKTISALDIIWFVLYVTCIALVCFIIVRICVQRTLVEGSSMETTLSDGDNLFVLKCAYTFSKPERYDVVVFDYDKGNDTHYIKRIIGLPGETVQIKDGYVYIDGNKLTDDTYGNELMSYYGIASEPVKLEEGKYFVLGDNRNASSDSRYGDVGVVDKGQIIGKAWLRFYPFDKFGSVE